MSTFTSFIRSAPLTVIGSVTDRVAELTALDAVIRTPLPLSRRVGFVSLRGGSGTSTTAGYVANLLARRRSGPVLGVDASAGPAGMLWHSGLSSTAELRPSGRRRTARRFADSVDGLPRTPSGLWSLRLAPAGSVSAPASSASWWDSCSPISRFFDLVVTDWGVRDARVDLAEAVAASHVVCVVARADRHTAEQAGAIVDAVREQENAPEVLIALVDVGGTAGASAPVVAEATGAPVLTVPYDAARSAARPVPATALGTRTRVEYARLAAAVMESALVSAGSRAARVPARAVVAPDPAPAPAVPVPGRRRRTEEDR
ncbi:MAG: hypothetical protein ABWZ77_03865 [Naasia sp.]